MDFYIIMHMKAFNSSLYPARLFLQAIFFLPFVRILRRQLTFNHAYDKIDVNDGSSPKKQKSFREAKKTSIIKHIYYIEENCFT